MEYKIISINDINDVTVHLRNSFFSDEPLNNAAGLCKKGEGNVILEDECCKTVLDNMSIMAVQDKQIAGVVLNGLIRPGDILKAMNKLDSCNDENYKKIFKLLYSFNLKNDLFKYCNVGQIFDMRILSVDPKFRGKGIAKQLIKNAEQLAKDYGFEVLKADATGAFSQKLLKSNGFSCFADIYYDNYIDKNGKPIFSVAAPHNKLELLYKKVHISKDCVYN